MIRRWLDVLAPHDLLIPRRMLALTYVMVVAVITASTLIGFLGGYLLNNDRHATERGGMLGEYTRQLDIKDARINALTWQIVEAQEAVARHAVRTDEMLAGMLLVLEQLADNISHNRANAKQLAAAAAELRRLRNAPRPTAPAPRPQIGPPPQAPLVPDPRPAEPTNLYLN